MTMINGFMHICCACISICAAVASAPVIGIAAASASGIAVFAGCAYTLRKVNKYVNHIQVAKKGAGDTTRTEEVAIKSSIITVLGMALASMVAVLIAPAVTVVLLPACLIGIVYILDGLKVLASIADDYSDVTLE